MQWNVPKHSWKQMHQSFRLLKPFTSTEVIPASLEIGTLKFNKHVDILC